MNVASVVQAPVAARPLTSGVRFLQGGELALRALTAQLQASSAPLAAEIVQAKYAPVMDLLAERAAAGQGVDLLVNAHVQDPAWYGRGFDSLAQMQADGARVAMYGNHTSPIAQELWLHSKLFHFNDEGPETWFMNAALTPRTLHDTELTAVVHGPAAAAAQRVTRAAIADDRVATRQAQLGAAQLGVLSNDPLTGVSTLSDEIFRAVDSARDELHVVAKAIDFPEFSHRLARVAARPGGPRVVVSVRDLAASDARILQHSRVELRMLGQQVPRHRVNAIIADDRVILTSAYPWAELLGSRAQPIVARESGLLLAGEAALQARTAVEQIVAHSVDEPVRPTHPLAPRLTAEDLLHFRMLQQPLATS